MQKLKGKSGITLIALVITIIVLLILAGISISMLSGDNSILNRATEAKNLTGEKSTTERVQLAYTGALARTNGKTTDTEFRNAIEEELNKEFGTGNYSLAGNVSGVKIDGKGYAFNGAISGTTEEEKTAMSKQNEKTPSDIISEMEETEITNENLKDIGRIKAVLTGEVPIPVNATYKEGTKNTGVVIEYKGSEFVWVPVPEINKMVMCNKHTSGDCDIHINEEGTAFECRTETHKVNNVYNTEIVGRLYAIEDGENFNSSLTTQRYNANSGYREPAILTGNSSGTGTNYDGSSNYYKTVLGYNSSVDFLDALKQEYKTMALGVAKYGGFYIGRFETSLDGATVASKRSLVESGDGAIMPMNAADDNNQMWYGMYRKQKAFSSKGLQSSMIWGSQYDAMLKWVLGGVDASHVTEKTNANHNTSIKGTGTNETDKMNNIYDLEGSLYEWTLEACGNIIRVLRGGLYGYASSPSYRAGYYPNGSLAGYASRLSLYIK